MPRFMIIETSESQKSENNVKLVPQMNREKRNEVCKRKKMLKLCRKNCRDFWYCLFFHGIPQLGHAFEKRHTFIKVGPVIQVTTY